MVSFFFTLFRFARAIARGLRDPALRALLIVLIFVLAGGTLFYSNVEGWNAIDALYFSVITLTTVGYGDLHPTTLISKIFTVINIFVGIGIIMAFIERFATHYLRRDVRRKASAETAEAGDGKDT